MTFVPRFILWTTRHAIVVHISLSIDAGCSSRHARTDPQPGSAEMGASDHGFFGSLQDLLFTVDTNKETNSERVTSETCDWDA